MKFPTLPSVAAALFLLLPCAAQAAEEPEAVYARFHRAIASGDLEEMLRNAPEARRARMAALSAADQDAALKIMRRLMPRTYQLRSKTVDPGGGSARLMLSGPGEAPAGRKPAAVYGTITLLTERGEWKVDQASWSSDRPDIPASVRPAGPRPAPKSAAPAPGIRSAPVVGTMSSAPERKLGAAAEPCVYKPVMTDEEIEKCR